MESGQATLNSSFKISRKDRGRTLDFRNLKEKEKDRYSQEKIRPKTVDKEEFLDFIKT